MKLKNFLIEQLIHIHTSTFRAHLNSVVAHARLNIFMFQLIARSFPATSFANESIFHVPIQSSIVFVLKINIF